MRVLLAAAVGFTLALSIAAVALGGRESATAPSIRIAEVTTTDARAVVTATRRGNESAPTARIAVATFKRTSGSWIRTGTRVLPGTYFWNTVTAPRAICRLDLRAGSATGASRARVLIQLLTTPSIGCGRTHKIAL
jgi:hypothetical protein